MPVEESRWLPERQLRRTRSAQPTQEAAATDGAADDGAAADGAADEGAAADGAADVGAVVTATVGATVGAALGDGVADEEHAETTNMVAAARER